jgi:hypothetical protein
MKGRSSLVLLIDHRYFGIGIQSTIGQKSIDREVSVLLGSICIAGEKFSRTKFISTADNKCFFGVETAYLV